MIDEAANRAARDAGWLPVAAVDRYRLVVADHGESIGGKGRLGLPRAREALRIKIIEVAPDAQLADVHTEAASADGERMRGFIRGAWRTLVWMEEQNLSTDGQQHLLVEQTDFDVNCLARKVERERTIEERSAARAENDSLSRLELRF